jgi:phospholipid-binding lipoprotein MlaA
MKLIVFIFSISIIIISNKSFARDNFDDDIVLYANSNVCKTVKDPLQAINKKIFYFNGAIDYIALYPTAKIYDRFINSSIKRAVNNFLLNLDQPYSAVNSLLQGKIENSLLNFWSFIINSTLGLGGIGDIASELGIKSQTENIGNTLAYYGAGPGPYIVLPILGVMTARDIPDKILKSFLEPMEFISSDLNILVFIMNNVNARSKSLAFGDYISSTSLDIYSSIRSMYIQKRENEVQYPSGFRCKH